MSEFYLIVGLGNPGPRYARNRHNIGFQVIDALAETYGLKFTRSEHNAQSAHGSIGAARVILAKPQTWMNDSGRSIAPLSRFYKIERDHMLLVYDDLDIPVGTLRFRAAGSSGGHRGVESTIQHLGHAEVPRLRVGIGRPPGQMDPAAYVLQDFSTEEQAIVWDVLRQAKQLVIAWLEQAPDFLRQGMTWRVETPA